MHKSAVRVVDPPMLDDGAVSLDMSVVHGHAVIVIVEDRWFVHVVPSAVEVIGPNEIRSKIQASPEILSV